MKAVFGIRDKYNAPIIHKVDGGRVTERFRREWVANLRLVAESVSQYLYGAAMAEHVDAIREEIAASPNGWFITDNERKYQAPEQIIPIDEWRDHEIEQRWADELGGSDIREDAV